MRTDTLSNILGAIMLIAIGAVGMYIYMTLADVEPPAASEASRTPPSALSSGLRAGISATERQLAATEARIEEIKREQAELRKSGEDFLREMQGY